MKKHRFLLVPALLLSFSLAACGARGGSPGAEMTPGGAPEPQPSTMASASPMEPPSSENSGYDFTANQEYGGETAVPPNSKLILRASLVVESTEFDKAVAALDQLVSAQGGYYESNEIQQGTYYDAHAARYGNFTIRVPQEHFNTFLDAAGTVGHVVSSSKSSEDVGEAYYDTEARLKTQQTKHERLLALLEQADNMENIIALENALSDVEYQIEQLTGTLRKYNSLVGYSTITVNLSEVLKITEQTKETTSLGGRVSNAFQGGLDSMGQNLSNLAVWAAYHFIGIIIFLLIAGAAAVVGIREYHKRRPKITPIKEENKE